MKIKETPSFGDKRVRKKFLWWPKTFYKYEQYKSENGNSVIKWNGKKCTYWFEWVKLHEEYTDCSGQNESSAGYWNLKEWKII